MGVRGDGGLGCAEENNCIEDIDFLVATFGKALASVGAYVVCNQAFRDYLLNTTRPFIFSTALPPVNALWRRVYFGAFIDVRRPPFGAEARSEQFRNALKSRGNADISTSHIVPFIVGEAPMPSVYRDNCNARVLCVARSSAHGSANGAVALFVNRRCEREGCGSGWWMS